MEATEVQVRPVLQDQQEVQVHPALRVQQVLAVAAAAVQLMLILMEENQLRWCSGLLIQEAEQSKSTLRTERLEQ